MLHFCYEVFKLMSPGLFVKYFDTVYSKYIFKQKLEPLMVSKSTLFDQILTSLPFWSMESKIQTLKWLYILEWSAFAMHCQTIVATIKTVTSLSSSLHLFTFLPKVLYIGI